MIPVAITGLGVVAPTGIGSDMLAAAAAAANGNGGLHGRRDAGAPDTSPFVLEDFDVRALLGRRGTSFLDRCTSIALVACGEALHDSGIDSERAERIGVALGTTTGSLRSMSDYTRDTLVEARPYHVNPGLFPNTVMNCAAGQAAIRHGLRGLNNTIAGGPISFFAVLLVAARTLRLGHLDATLAGAVEEFSPHRAWQNSLARVTGGGPSGEGAAVLALERPDDARRAGRPVDGLVEAVVTGFSPGGETGGGLAAALEGCAVRALAGAGVAPAEIACVACSPPVETAHPRLGVQAARAALAGHEPAALEIDGLVGDCGAATAALQVAALLSRHRAQPEREAERALLLGWTVEGGVSAAVVTALRSARPAGATAT
jgi:3-oxoacyl-[acyl-carrier-protein] synthase II